MASLTIDCAGERLALHPEGLIAWPRRRTLIIADTHFGKDTHFRRAGAALPTGPLEHDLARLDRLLAATAAQRLIVLGDLVHAAPAPGDRWPERITAWRRTHPELEWLAVAGNHDAGFTPPAGWRIDWYRDAIVEPPFVFAHEPGTHPAGYVVAGHWHPVARLAAAGDTVRAPIFAVGPAYAVLPAFGSFTGGAVVDDPALTRFALVEDRVLPLPRQ